MNYKSILVTGGSGMTGKSLQKIMPQAHYISSRECNLINLEEVEALFEKYRPDCVVHLAAKAGGIFDNIKKPAEYFDENILINTNVLRVAKKYDVQRLIAILSTCAYPDVVDNYPMKEEDMHKGPPASTNISYGYSKRALSVQIDAYNKQYGTRYQYITPCNLYGEYDKYGENSHFVAALIKKIHQAKIYGEEKITLFGSGKPLRQFMHSDDLAKIIKRCIEDGVYENFNVATEQNISIDDIARIALRACNASDLKIEYDTTKPDGQFRKDVSIEKMKSLFPDFSPTKLFHGIVSTYSILQQTWKHTA
ncbi:MAG: NAD-dependent epimerase/dehydratase family protein [Nanoarchaeota archaeon]